jgi:hypothetical protein
MCTDFQRRSKKVNEIIKKNEVWSMKLWSIMLGFKGAVTDEFHDKYKSVVKVRKRIMNELYISIFSFIGFLFVYLTSLNLNNEFIWMLQYPMYIFMGLSILSFFAHLKIVVEWKNHDLEMLEKFYGLRNNDDN